MMKKSNDNKDFCISCPSHSYCSTDCPEYKLYVNQAEEYDLDSVSVPQRETTYGLVPTDESSVEPWPDIVNSSKFKGLSKKELSLFILVASGKSRDDVCELIDITKNYYSQIVHRIQLKLQSI